jgi:hypothetical protein
MLKALRESKLENKRKIIDNTLDKETIQTHISRLFEFHAPGNCVGMRVCRPSLQRRPGTLENDRDKRKQAQGICFNRYFAAVCQF